jgi:hypothetical protein
MNRELPVPLTNAVHQYACAHQNYKDAAHAFAKLSTELERDCMTMALRLFSESEDTFSPETIDVMNKWRPRVLQLLQGQLNES